MTVVHSNDKCSQSVDILVHLNYVALLFCLFQPKGNEASSLIKHYFKNWVLVYKIHPVILPSSFLAKIDCRFH